MRKLTTHSTWWAWAAVAGVALTAGPAPAFYWKGWPGSGQQPPRSLIPPADAAKPGAPPGNPGVPPTFGVPPDIHPPTTPGNQPPDKPDNPGGPPPVPEPATGVAGLLGLAAVAAARRWRRGSR